MSPRAPRLPKSCTADRQSRGIASRENEILKQVQDDNI